MLSDTEAISLSKSLYTILKVEKCFTKNDFIERYGNQLIRIEKQFNNLNRKLAIVRCHIEEYRQLHNEKTPNEPQMTQSDVFIELTTLYCSFGLAHYELLKRFFIATLDLEHLSAIAKTKIRKPPTFGGIINTFKGLPNYNDKMAEMLDKDFRNALAHDSWYLGSNEMKYLVNDKLVQIPFLKIPQKIKIIGRAYTTISECYTMDFFPEIVDAYNKGLKNEIQKITPLFGMND